MPVTFPTRTVAVIAATAAAGLSGAVIAGAATNGSSSSAAVERPANQDRDGRGPGGPGGPGGHRHGPHADIAAVAATLGVTEAKLRAALDAARPDRGAKDGFASALAKQLGASTADVQAVLDASRPDGPRGGDRARGDRSASGDRAGRGDSSALAAALATQLGITQAKAQAALDALRRAHDDDRAGARDDLYAAVAKALGKETAAVKRAFEANRPERPATARG